MINPHRYCVIMCGGIGSRFWPYSRTSYPKQFIDFLGTGRSLLQMTYDRILPIVDKNNIILVTNEDYAPLVREQLPDISEDQLLLEPARRNTAPCIAWAARHIAALDPEASMIVAASDHLILGEKKFEEQVTRGFEFVEHHDALLTLGINPTRPETGYGYIQVGEAVAPHINRVKTFTEKPDLDLAKVFLQSGEFVWNSGIFLWSVQTILKAINDCAPDLANVFDKGCAAFGTPHERDFINAHFAGCPSISIDYAVMEAAKNVYVERVDFAWNDLGNWSALYDNSPKNSDGNVAHNCNLLSYNSSGNIVAVKGEKLIVMDGIKDYIIADTGDVLLLCPKAQEQRIKQMVNDIKQLFNGRYL